MCRTSKMHHSIVYLLKLQLFRKFKKAFFISQAIFILSLIFLFFAQYCFLCLSKWLRMHCIIHLITSSVFGVCKNSLLIRWLLFFCHLNWFKFFHRANSIIEFIHENSLKQVQRSKYGSDEFLPATHQCTLSAGKLEMFTEISACISKVLIFQFGTIVLFGIQSTYDA